MAKQGFSYYKAETDRFQDIKIKRLKKRYQCTGYAVYQYVLNEIYRVRGYCLKFSEDHLFDVSEYWGIDEELVTEIIGYCAEIGLFSATMWQGKGVLTARSIQARYIDICKVCKKTPVIEEELRLVAPEQAAPAPPPLPRLFPEEEYPVMRIVTGRTGAETTASGERPVTNTAAPAAPPLPPPAAPPVTASTASEETRRVTAQSAAPETPVQGIGTAILAQLEAAETKTVSEGFRKFPETSGNLPEESDKVINTKLSENIPSSNSPRREEEAKASPSSGNDGAYPERNEPAVERNGPAADKDRLLLLLKSLSLSPDDTRWVCTIEGIEVAGSPIWQLADEVRQSGGRLTVFSYLMPSLRSLVAVGRLRVRSRQADAEAELRQLLRSVKVPSYDVEKVLEAAQGLERALREAIEEVRRSKGKITMPTRYLLSQLRKAEPAKAS